MTVPWSHVQHTAERVAIVASGPSLKHYNLMIPDGIDVISVNGSIWPLAKAPRFWFTLDPSPANRAIMATAIARRCTTMYAAVQPNYGQPDARPRHLAMPPEPGVLYLKRDVGTGPRGSKNGLSTHPDRIHCGNSAYGALGLAFLMGAKRIALLGVDGDSAAGYAWGDGQPKNLNHLGRLFASAADQMHTNGVVVINGSPKSRVTCWPRTTPAAALEWLAT